jgi:hypothetical protein
MYKGRLCKGGLMYILYMLLLQAHTVMAQQPAQPADGRQAGCKTAGRQAASVPSSSSSSSSWQTSMHHACGAMCSRQHERGMSRAAAGIA